LRTVIVILSAALAIGCKDKPKTQPTVGSGSQSIAEGPATPGSHANPGHVLKLPKATGTPPNKSTALLTKQQLEKMSTLEFPGFKRDLRHIDERTLELRYKTEERPKIMVTVTPSHCFNCVPIELDKWKAKGDGLKTLLAPELRELSSTTFEVDQTELAGAKMIYTYQLGWIFGKDPQTDEQKGAYSNAYALYYNDGKNMIRVVAEYKDDPPGSREAMIKLVPREDLEKTAKAFVDAFTHVW
jgi:hypothetical protein